MDNLLPDLLSFPLHPPPQHPLSDHAYDEAIRAQILFVKKQSEGKLLQQTSGGENILDVSDLHTRSEICSLILLGH